MSSPKTVLITGSSGFIGKNIVDHLKDRYSLLTPNHKELDLLSQMDVDHFFTIHDIDTVVHCANFGGTRKKQATGEVLEKNLRMFFNITKNKECFSKFIHLGSGAEYNKNRNLKKISEKNFGKCIPLDEYGFSKYIISKNIENSENMYCLRLFGIFGKYEDYEFKFISNAIVKNLFHLPITIRQNVNFSWLYINDFLNVVDYFLANTPHKPVYNITPPTTTDLISIAQIINSCSEFNSDICVENEGLNFEYSGDNSQLLSEIPQLTFTPMYSAVEELFEYYKEVIPHINRELIQKDPYAAYCKIKL